MPGRRGTRGSCRGNGDTWAIIGATASLFISSAGAGLLSYPFAAQQQGIAVNLAATLAFAFLNGYTDLVLAATAYRVRRRLSIFTYEELCLHILGPTGYSWVVASVIIGCLGSIIAFFIVIGDMLVPVLHAICASSGADSSVCAVVTHRAFPVGIFAVAIALPFASCSRLHNLNGSSLLAAASVLAVAVLAVARGAVAITTGFTQCDEPSGRPAVEPTADPSDVHLWVGSGYQVILGMPLVVFALGNHVQAVPLFLELGKAHGPVHEEQTSLLVKGEHTIQSDDAVDAANDKTSDTDTTVWRTDSANPQLRFPWIVVTVMASCAVLYSAMGAFGFLACGAATQGDFLLNFSGGDAFADVARAFMAVHVALAVPVCAVPCRRAILMLSFFLRERRWGCCCGRRGREVAVAEDDVEATLLPLLTTASSATASSVRVAHDAMLRAYNQHANAAVEACGMGCGRTEVGLNLLIVVGSALVAIAFPKVQVVFGVLGATISTSQIYFIPGLLLWVRANEVESATPSPEDLNATETADHPADATDCSAAGESNSGTFLLFRVLPRSPRVMRAFAIGLFGVALFMCTLGTGTDIYSTWQ